MKKYIVHYYSSPEDMAKMAMATPEEKMAGMKPWMDWKEAMGDHLVDMGSPLMPPEKIGNGANGGGSNPTGYSIIQAADANAAKALLVNHPHLQWSEASSIEISEFIPM